MKDGEKRPSLCSSGSHQQTPLNSLSSLLPHPQQVNRLQTKPARGGREKNVFHKTPSSARALRPREPQPTKFVTLRCPLWARMGGGGSCPCRCWAPGRRPRPDLCWAWGTLTSHPHGIRILEQASPPPSRPPSCDLTTYTTCPGTTAAHFNTSVQTLLIFTCFPKCEAS